MANLVLSKNNTSHSLVLYPDTEAYKFSNFHLSFEKNNVKYIRPLFEKEDKNNLLRFTRNNRNLYLTKNIPNWGEASKKVGNFQNGLMFNCTSGIGEEATGEIKKVEDKYSWKHQWGSYLYQVETLWDTYTYVNDTAPTTANRGKGIYYTFIINLTNFDGITETFYCELGVPGGEAGRGLRYSEFNPEGHGYYNSYNYDTFENLNGPILETSSSPFEHHSHDNYPGYKVIYNGRISGVDGPSSDWNGYYTRLRSLRDREYGGEIFPKKGSNYTLTVFQSCEFELMSSAFWNGASLYKNDGLQKLLNMKLAKEVYVDNVINAVEPNWYTKERNIT